MPEQTTPQNLTLLRDATVSEQVSERWIYALIGRGDLVKYRAKGRTYIDVDELRRLLVPRPVHNCPPK